jgi:hypothetical protein
MTTDKLTQEPNRENQEKRLDEREAIASRSPTMV